jgi:hypothetical protein
VTLGRVVREWKIEDRVGTVVSDNTSSNDSCLLHFYGDLDGGMSLVDIRARRMRCYGHILNLVARAFLYGEDFEAFEAESQVFDLLGKDGSNSIQFNVSQPTSTFCQGANRIRRLGQGVSQNTHILLAP